MTELRVYLPILDLQPQFAAYLSSPTRARGYPVYAGEHSLIVEVAPALSIHRIVDLALKASPDMEPGILFTERQFGLLELHSSIEAELGKPFWMVSVQNLLINYFQRYCTVILLKIYQINILLF